MAVFKDEKTKDGRQWCFRTYLNGKPYKSKKFMTKHEAEEMERLFLTERDNPIKKNFHIVALSYFKDLEKTNKSSSIQSYSYDYNKHIKPFFQNMEISSITLNDIKKWHEYMDMKELSLSFKNKVYSVLKNIFDYCMKNYDLPKNVCQIYGRFKEKKDTIYTEEIKYITLEEFNQFISVIDEPIWHCFFTLAFYSGMRKGEIFALTWKDINGDFININKTLSRGKGISYSITSTKTNQNRKVKMNRSLIEEMIKYKQIEQQRSDFLESDFIFGGKLPLSRTTVDRHKHYYFELSQVHEITMHQFRHSAVSLILNEMLLRNNDLDINKALVMLSSRFGHSPEVMLRTYAHFYEDKLQDPVVDILNDL